MGFTVAPPTKNLTPTMVVANLIPSICLCSQITPDSSVLSLALVLIEIATRRMVQLFFHIPYDKIPARLPIAPHERLETANLNATY